jgi:ATP-dependent Clp protease ATP-binding subunit ClpA
MIEQLLSKFLELARERVIGQESAIAKIKSALAAADASRNPARPLATLLFVGGPGSGRGTTAKILASALFDTEDACKPILVFDSIESQIIKTLSACPCVGVLRHTVESSNKLDQSAFASVLKRFHDNRPIADKNGRPDDLGSSIFIVTLNADLPLELTLSENNESEQSLRQWLQKQFKDKLAEDFFQSFDAIIAFKHLGVPTKTRLAEMKIKELIKEQAASGRTLLVDNSVAAYVGSRAKDEFGALDVQRALDQYVGNPFHEAVLKHEAAGKRPKTIRIHVVEDGVRISAE